MNRLSLNAKVVFATTNEIGKLFSSKSTKLLLYKVTTVCTLTNNRNTIMQSCLCSNNHRRQEVLAIKPPYYATPKMHMSTSNSLKFNKEWTKILTKAEKVVGYPTSFLNLRYLVSDEVAHFANLLRKLMQTKHPLIKMARRLVMNNDSEQKRTGQMNGIIVLLISKAAGIPRTSSPLFLESDISDGIHHSQRCLAEIAEMIYMGSLIHKGVLDLKHLQQQHNTTAEHIDEMGQGNKLAVLCGDYLLASACTNLSKLHNTQVVDLMSQVIADISQGIFDNENIKNTRFSFLKLWYDRLNSNSASLLANSAKSSLLLVQHSPRLQEVAFSFAKHLDIAYKIWQELADFKKDSNLINKPDSLANAVYLDNYSTTKTNENSNNNNHDERVTNENVTSSSSSSSILNKMFAFNSSSRTTTTTSVMNDDVQEKVFHECKSLFDNHLGVAMESLEMLQNENSQFDAIASLKSILNLMKSTSSI